MTSRTHSFRVPADISGLAPRIALLIVAGWGMLVLVPTPMWQVTGMVVVLIGVVAPRSLAAWMGLAAVPIGLLSTDPTAGRTALAVLIVHAAHVLASLTLVVPARSHLSARALRASARRFVVIELIAQPLAFGATILTGTAPAAGVVWLAPAGAALLLGAVLLVLRVLRRQDADAKH